VKFQISPALADDRQYIPWVNWALSYRNEIMTPIQTWLWKLKCDAILYGQETVLTCKTITANDKPGKCRHNSLFQNLAVNLMISLWRLMVYYNFFQNYVGKRRNLFTNGVISLLVFNWLPLSETFILTNIGGLLWCKY
jgi:hypothetical protein